MQLCAAEREFPGPTASSFAGSDSVLQRMQFLARFKADRFAGRDAHLGAGSWVATDAGFAGAYTEDAKTAQFDALTGGESLLKALEDRIHRGFCLGAGQAGALNYMMDDVLFDHGVTSFCAIGMNVLRPME